MLAFMGEAWIEKNDRGTQSYPSYDLVLIAKKGRRGMAYVRKALGGDIEVVKQADNHII